MMPNAPPPPSTGDKNPSDAGAKPPQPRAFNVPPVTLTAAGLLIAAFAILTFMPIAWTVGIIELFAVRPIVVAAALRDPLQIHSALAALTLVTYALIHIDGIHIALNVGFLLAFGGGCERLFGRRRFVAILFLSAIAGAAAKLAMDWNAPIVMYGASGAVFGCMGAFFRLMIGGPPQLRRKGLISAAFGGGRERNRHLGRPTDIGGRRRHRMGCPCRRLRGRRVAGLAAEAASGAGRGLKGFVHRAPLQLPYEYPQRL